MSEEPGQTPLHVTCINCGQAYAATKSYCPNCGKPKGLPGSWPPSPARDSQTIENQRKIGWTGVFEGFAVCLVFTCVMGLGVFLAPILYFSTRKTYKDFALGTQIYMITVLVILLGMGICTAVVAHFS